MLGDVNMSHVVCFFDFDQPAVGGSGPGQLANWHGHSVATPRVRGATAVAHPHRGCTGAN